MAEPQLLTAEQLMKLLADHRTARPGRRDDVLVVLEDLDEPLGQWARFSVEAVVEKRLAAAGLRLRKLDAAAEVLEQLGDRDADVGVKLVRQTGNKKRDVVLGHG